MSSDDLEIVAREGGIEFTVKVVPRASRTKLSGRWGQALKVAVAAPPAGGQANAAVIALLADRLGVKPSQVTIVRGHTQPVKRIAVAGLTEIAARARLSR
jgi:uncharacterized protein (TIGR00251 family)